MNPGNVSSVYIRLLPFFGGTEKADKHSLGNDLAFLVLGVVDLSDNRHLTGAGSQKSGKYCGSPNELRK